MTIDLDNLDNLIADGDKIFLRPEGEQVLIDFLALEQKVADARNAIKEKLEAAALKLSPNFSSIASERVRVSYRAFGNRYAITGGLEGKVPDELTKVEVKTTLDTAALDKWTKEHGALPYGVEIRDRQKTITFALAGNDEAIED